MNERERTTHEPNAEAGSERAREERIQSLYAAAYPPAYPSAEPSDELSQRVAGLAARHDARRPHLLGDGLWIVERHGPPAAMVARARITRIGEGILVKLLLPGPGWVQVAVAMRVHHIAWPQHARQRAIHNRMMEYLLDLRDTW